MGTYICVVLVGGEPSVERDCSDPGVVDSTTSPLVGRIGGDCLVAREYRGTFEHQLSLVVEVHADFGNRGAA